MSRRFDRLRCCLLGLFAVTLAHAQSAASGGAPPGAVATGNQPPTPVVASAWDISETIRASVGWRDNVTVSALNPLNRGFYRGEADCFVLRPINEHWEFLSFLSADVLRYLSPPPGIPGEQQWLGHLEGRWQPGTFFRTALKAVGFRQDIFIDPSETEGTQSPALWVKLRGGYSTLEPRFALPWKFYLSPSYQVKGVRYLRGYNGNYNETRPGLQLQWKRSDLLDLSVTGYDHRRHYSELVQSAAGGRLIPHRLLSLHQPEVEAKAASSFNLGGAWTVAATVGRLENRDRAYGYLDYNQKSAGLSLDWTRGPWHATANANGRRLNYVTQIARTGIGAPHRIADIYDTLLRLERDLPRKWMIFAENRWERNRSNIDETDLPYRFNYHTDTVLIGLQRSF